MYETEKTDWEHWFSNTKDEIAQLIFTSYFYETALMYYNIVVDLSWVICYISAEYACRQNGNMVQFDKMKTIEEAVEAFRSAEYEVASPTAKSNPFGYMRKINPTFSNAIDMITEFWKGFCSTGIRKKYNFIKHRGKPKYSEIESLKGGNFIQFFVISRNTVEKVELASDIRDVQMEFSLFDGISELFAFDDDKLFPYIKGLITELEDRNKPSSIV